MVELREILCRVLRQDGWTIGLWCGGLTGRCGAVTRYADGPLRRRGGFGLERRWAAKAGTVLFGRGRCPRLGDRLGRIVRAWGSR